MSSDEEDISRTTATATVHCLRKMGSVGNCIGVLKPSAATGKINVLTTNHTTTHRQLMNLEICCSKIIW